MQVYCDKMAEARITLFSLKNRLAVPCGLVLSLTIKFEGDSLEQNFCLNFCQKIHGHLKVKCSDSFGK